MESFIADTKLRTRCAAPALFSSDSDLVSAIESERSGQQGLGLCESNPRFPYKVNHEHHPNELFYTHVEKVQITARNFLIYLPTESSGFL